VTQSTLGATVRYEGAGVITDEVLFTVDGVDLLTHLGVDSSQLTGPPTRVVCPPSDHLFGGPDRWEDPRDSWFDEGKVAIAGDWCGQPGCRAVLMHVTVREDEVVWSDFELYRAPSAAPTMMQGRFEGGELVWSTIEGGRDEPTGASRLSGIELHFDLEQYRNLLATLCGPVD